MAGQTDAERRSSLIYGFSILAVIVGVLVYGGVKLLGGGGSGSRPSYSGTVTDHTVINPAVVSVTVTVANSGNKSGSPSCTVFVSDPGGAYTGFDTQQANTAIPAGGLSAFTADVTVKHEGAAYVTDFRVDCS